MNSLIDAFCLRTIMYLVRNCPNDRCASTAMYQVRALLEAWDKVNGPPDRTEHDSELSLRNAQLAQNLENALRAKDALLNAFNETIERIEEIPDDEINELDSLIYGILMHARKTAADIGAEGEGDPDDADQ